MQHAVRYGTIALVLLFFWPGFGWAARTAPAKTGFLVIAQDRGFLGNQEVQAVFEEFKNSSPAPVALALVGRNYNGVGSEYSAYLSRALAELQQAGAARVIGIPLFLSAADPVLAKVLAHLPAYPGGGAIQWEAPMSASYLIAQILLDRVEPLSQEPEQERVLLLSVGAMDETSAKAMQAEGEKLLAYLTQRKPFKETRALIYYDRDAQGAEEKNKAVDRVIVETAAKKGRTLLVPAFIGPKFDNHMALVTWIGQKFKDLDLVYVPQELLPHPNVLLWLKKTANRHVAAAPHDIGVVIMPHGATQPYNDAVEQTIAPLKAKYKIEMAYGMGDPGVIQQAVSRLEQQGVRRIVFVRMYALADQLKDVTDYILGLSDSPPGHGHDHDAIPPAQVRSAAVFSTFGGYEENPAIAEILHERIVELSKDPPRETVILVAHGAKSDAADAQWHAVMNGHIERLRKDPHCAKLRAIHAATVREDWPEQREKAVAQLKELIAQSNHSGQVLLVSNRLYGAGPYKKLLEGATYVMNEKGFAPHPALTRWLERGIEQAITAMTAV